MNRLATYLRQTFIEDISVPLFGTGILLTVFCWTIGIFYWGIDLLLMPVMMGLMILSLAGPFIIIKYLVRKNRSGQGIKTFGRLKSLAFGTYLGLFLLSPITNWDKDQRQKSGLIIAQTLEHYKSRHGSYPTTLSEIKNELTPLPPTYSLDKFDYHITDTSYDLDIPAAIMDRWHWDKEKNDFIYSDW